MKHLSLAPRARLAMLALSTDGLGTVFGGDLVATSPSTQAVKALSGDPTAHNGIPVQDITGSLTGGAGHGVFASNTGRPFWVDSNDVQSFLDNYVQTNVGTAAGAISFTTTGATIATGGINAVDTGENVLVTATMSVHVGSGVTSTGTVQVFRGGTPIGEPVSVKLRDTTTAVAIIPLMVIALDVAPGAGTHTYTVKGTTDGVNGDQQATGITVVSQLLKG